VTASICVQFAIKVAKIAFRIHVGILAPPFIFKERQQCEWVSFTKAGVLITNMKSIFPQRAPFQRNMQLMKRDTQN